MTRIAKKKGVDNKAGYVVKPIAVKDIEKQADFGTFKITRTRECIAYTNYVGYSVITKPYTTTPFGQATELSLYEWLNYLLESKDEIEKHKNEPFLINGNVLFRDREDAILDDGTVDVCYYRQYKQEIERYKAENNGLPEPDGKYWLLDDDDEYNEYIYKDADGTWWPKSTIFTYGDWLENLKMITEANLTKPCVVFTDADYAKKAADEHSKWLDEKLKQLRAAMTQTPPEEDEKKNEEEFGRAVGDENLRNNLQLDNIEGD